MTYIPYHADWIDSPDGVTPSPTPILAVSLEHIEQGIVGVESAAALALATHVATLPFNVKDYGAVGNGVANDTTAIQAAITACISAGGGIVFLPPGNYKITAAITVNCGSANVCVSIVGSGRRTTKITQATSATDILVCGVTGAENCDFLAVRDITLTGGRYPLRLNNCLSGSFERLSVVTCTTGVYIEGQNESHTFRDVDLVGCTLHGIHAGNTNGGTGSSGTDFPEMQKCLFEKIRVNGCTTGTSILVTAGVLGGQQSSGSNVFRKILLETNAKDGFEVQHSFNTTIEQLSNEEAYDTANTYSAIRLGTGCGFVSVRDCHIAGSGVVTAKYGIEQVDGVALIERCTTGAGGAAGTADIFINGVAATVIDSCVTDATKFVVGVGPRPKTMAINLSDNAGVPIVGDATNYMLLYPFNGGLAVGGSIKTEAGGLYVQDAGSFQKYATGVVKMAEQMRFGGYLYAATDGGTNALVTMGQIGPSGKAGISVNQDRDTTLYRDSAGVLRCGEKLTATGGIGVGNSAAATTPGTVVKKMEVFDAAGTSLGFVPIYNAIT